MKQTIMKKLILFTAVLFFLSFTTKKELIKIPIINDKEAKAAGFNIFFVPIKLAGIEKQFKMQFDLGLDVSAIYGNSLQAICEKYPNLKKNFYVRDEYQIVKTKYYIAGIESNLDSLLVFANYGSDKKFEEQDIIGSIGVNQFKNKILLINYNEHYIQILDNDSQIDKEKFYCTPMTVTKNNKIIINLKAGDSFVPFLFDSGNGVPLVTINKNFFDEQTENQKELRDTISGNSWGETIRLFGAKQQKNIGTENTNFTIGQNRIYYTQANKIVEQFKEMNVEHSIGNNFFMGKTILFDFKNNKFGLKKQWK